MNIRISSLLLLVVLGSSVIENGESFPIHGATRLQQLQSTHLPAMPVSKTPATMKRRAETAGQKRGR